jgi:hypothetical protein
MFTYRKNNRFQKKSVGQNTNIRLATALQRPRKHFESGGALAKRGTFVYDQNQTILCRSRAERKFLKIWSLYDVGNGLYRVFTAAKKALSFQQKRAFIQ